MANDIGNSPLTMSVLSNPAADIARAAPKALPVSQPAPKREENNGRSFAEELSRGHERPARDIKEAKDPRDSKESVDHEKTLAADQPKKIKETVKKAAASNLDGVESAPSVAFFAGRLDQIDATKIPTLVADSPFISQAMVQEDIAQFMSQPTSIMDMAKNLGLPINFLMEVQNLGLDPSQKMAPIDFFKAIGIDPQQVVAELNLLKGNLLTDGMAPYLNRAAALVSKNQKPTMVAPKIERLDQPMETPALDLMLGQVAVDWSPANLGQLNVDGKKDLIDQLDGKLQPAFLLNAAAMIAAQQNQGQQVVMPLDLRQFTANQNPSIKIEAASPETAVLSNLVKQLTVGGQDAEAEPDQTAAQLAAQMGSVPLTQQATLSMDRFAEITNDTKGALIVERPVDLPSEARPDLLIAQTPASMKKATFDAFAVMGEQLKGMDTVKFDVGQIAADAADKAATESSILYGVNSSQAVTAMSGGMGAMTALAGSQVGVADKFIDNLGSKERTVQRNGSREAASVSGAAQDGKQAGQNITAVQPRGDSSARQDNGASSNQNGSQFAGDKSSSDVQANRGVAQPTRNTQTQSAFAPRAEQSEQGLSPQQRYQIMQKVLNHATMMVKEGGGTVRLDLGTSELGSVQMAINMNQDQVDMRVITNSDRVREAMMSELSQLKNALSVQNVRLGNVEVGVSGRQPNGFTGFEGNFSQGRGRDFDGRERGQQAGITGIKGVGSGMLRGPLNVDSSSVPNLFANNGGRIAVRA